MSDHESSTSAPEEKSPAKEENKDTEESANEEEETEESTTKTPKKSPKKIKKQSNSEDEDEENSAGEKNGDDNDDSDEDKPVGLLDRPVEIQSGHRERKKVERLEMNFALAPKDKKLDIPEGSGEKLGDCPRIELQLQKSKADELKHVHRILFNRPGSTTTLRRNIRRFSGFTFKKGSPDFERKELNLAKLTTINLKQVCEILDLEKGGTKEDMIPRIMSFLMKPKSSGKPLPKSKKSKSPRTEKRKSNSKKTVKKNSKKIKRRKNKDSDSESESEKSEKEESEEEEEKEEDEPEADEEEEEEEEEEKSNYDSDDEPKKKKSKTVSKTPKKKEKEKKTEKKPATKRKKESSGDESDSSDDEPLVKKVKAPPTDDELKDNIKKILDGANLEEVTMKSVCKQVYAKYPDHDLTTRKDFIKATVKTIIS